MLKIRIETRNDAFASSDGISRKSEECCRILEEVIDKVRRGDDEGVCHDINGNKVGNWKLTKR